MGYFWGSQPCVPRSRGVTHQTHFFSQLPERLCLWIACFKSRQRVLCLPGLLLNSTAQFEHGMRKSRGVHSSLFICLRLISVRTVPCWRQVIPTSGLRLHFPWSPTMLQHCGSYGQNKHRPMELMRGREQGLSS